jgi:hypothetical protein
VSLFPNTVRSDEVDIPSRAICARSRIRLVCSISTSFDLPPTSNQSLLTKPTRTSFLKFTAAKVKKTLLHPTPVGPNAVLSKKAKAAAAQGKQVTKFKIRCSRYLYTLVLEDGEKAEKLRQSLPPGESTKLGIWEFKAERWMTDHAMVDAGLAVEDVGAKASKK